MICENENEALWGSLRSSARFLFSWPWNVLLCTLRFCSMYVCKDNCCKTFSVSQKDEMDMDERWASRESTAEEEATSKT
jgi:hypothetical protein